MLSQNPNNLFCSISIKHLQGHTMRLRFDIGIVFRTSSSLLCQILGGDDDPNSIIPTGCAFEGALMTYDVV